MRMETTQTWKNRRGPQRTRDIVCKTLRKAQNGLNKALHWFCAQKKQSKPKQKQNCLMQNEKKNLRWDRKDKWDKSFIHKIPWR